MPRAFRVYCLLVALTFVLAGASVWAAHLDDPFGWNLELTRFLLGAGLVAAAVSSWATAIFIAYVHRVTWPVVVLVGMVVIAGGGFAFRCPHNLTRVLASPSAGDQGGP